MEGSCGGVFVLWLLARFGDWRVRWLVWSGLVWLLEQHRVPVRAMLLYRHRREAVLRALVL